MKLVTLMRHAKSSWENPAASDFERTLNARGIKDAPVMGSRLIKRSCVPDFILCSTAARARATADAIHSVLLEESDNSVGNIEIEYTDDIYEASAGTLLSLIENTAESARHLMLVGHNPGMEQLGAILNEGTMTTMPTCAVAHFTVDCESWNEITSAGTTRVFFDYPKNKDFVTQ